MNTFEEKESTYLQRFLFLAIVSGFLRPIFTYIFKSSKYIYEKKNFLKFSLLWNFIDNILSNRTLLWKKKILNTCNNKNIDKNIGLMPKIYLSNFEIKIFREIVSLAFSWQFTSNWLFVSRKSLAHRKLGGA